MWSPWLGTLIMFTSAPGYSCLNPATNSSITLISGGSPKACRSILPVGSTAPPAVGVVSVALDCVGWVAAVGVAAPPPTSQADTIMPRLASTLTRASTRLLLIAILLRFVYLRKCGSGVCDERPWWGVGHLRRPGIETVRSERSRRHLQLR